LGTSARPVIGLLREAREPPGTNAKSQIRLFAFLRNFIDS
jgi:hypothetical protein